MVNYANGKIYKMESPNGLIYIGSTCRTLAERLASHKAGYKKWLSGRNTYTSSFKLLQEDCENTTISLILDYPCSSVKQLHKKEGETMKEYDCVNLHVAGNGDTRRKEWQTENRERLSVLRKQRYVNRKDHENTVNKSWYEANKSYLLAMRAKRYKCLCGSTYSHGNVLAHRKSKRHNKFMSIIEMFKRSDPMMKGAIETHERILNLF